MTTPRPAVLLVDDVEDNLVAMKAALDPLGYRVVTAESGEAALRELLLADFSLVVLDVQMPGIDGFETARAIKGRQRTNDVPILFVTAINREDDHRLHGYASGGVDYLFKPISPELLRAKAAVFVQLFEQRRLLLEQRRELEAKTAELERANRDLEQFTYIASHDLQEPLRVVSGYLELLGDAVADGGDVAPSWIERASSTVERMAAMIQDLLVCARAGTTSAPAVAVDVGGAARAAVEHLGRAIADAHAIVDIDVDPATPCVAAAESEVVQVLQNVIANAIHHRAEADPEITVTAYADGEVVEVEVADNGPGVPEQDLERVFGLFERLDGSPYPGTGLGLAICRRIVQHRGGRIWITSPPGRGATVHVRLPVHP